MQSVGGSLQIVKGKSMKSGEFEADESYFEASKKRMKMVGDVELPQIGRASCRERV